MGVKLNSGWCATVENLRLPLRARDGSVRLILGSSVELPTGTLINRLRRLMKVAVTEARILGSNFEAKVD